MKPIKAIVKLQLPGGAATPGQQIGQALGQHGLNLAEFCSKFNAATSDKVGDIVPVEITVYQDRTYDFITKTPPAAYLLRKAAGIEKGSGNPLKDKVGKVTRAQIKEIAQKKMPDLNAEDIEAAEKIIEGTARSMGIKVE
ncbi:MAG: 50S ribosomal protein L11 [Candidatus Portnoybacteria bacterium RBG_19FT_COMBO_36_7]|uniref:Large ribosomal subunit protein uL11 n=1 Tax=Candidatus Portnoybacteria bacterium RBG_19FT_COMBO_36_7 TaxID=1801992 RepID=A0A1G2F889_9BACT|nr:MAG: 50S ribosomal protein L11 [Candidatus Portnoybacteria bacterium RBG_19FT_COMBO_36_7]